MSNPVVFLVRNECAFSVFFQSPGLNKSLPRPQGPRRFVGEEATNDQKFFIQSLHHLSPPNEFFVCKPLSLIGSSVKKILQRKSPSAESRTKQKLHCHGDPTIFRECSFGSRFQGVESGRSTFLEGRRGFTGLHPQEVFTDFRPGSLQQPSCKRWGIFGCWPCHKMIYFCSQKILLHLRSRFDMVWLNMFYPPTTAKHPSERCLKAFSAEELHFSKAVIVSEMIRLSKERLDATDDCNGHDVKKVFFLVRNFTEGM